MSKDKMKKAERNNNEAKRLATQIEGLQQLILTGAAVHEAQLVTIERLESEKANIAADKVKLHSLLFTKSEEFEALQAKYDAMVANANKPQDLFQTPNLSGLVATEEAGVLLIHDVGPQAIQEPGSVPTDVNDAVTATIQVDEALLSAGA